MFTILKKGFTLIELLVVIAIIAILAAILFPVFAQAREKARQTTCLSNLKQMGTAFVMYLDDYDETFPPYIQLNSSGQPIANNDWNTPGGWRDAYTVSGVGGRVYAWHDSIFPYVKNLKMFKCPTRNNDYSYGYSSEVSGTLRIKMGVGEVLNQAPASISMIKQPATLLMAGDYYSSSPMVANYLIYGSNQPLNDYWYVMNYIHMGRISSNYVFADGHAKAMQAKSFSGLYVWDPMFCIDNQN